MPARILHIVDSLGQGGLENGLVNLIQRTDPHRFEHVVCAIRSLGVNAERLPSDRVRIMCLEKKDSDSPIQVLRLSRAISEVGPDIVHSRNWAAVEAVIAARWSRRAVVHSEHGLDAVTAGNDPWRRRCFRRLAFHLADKVVTVSDELRKIHAQRTGFPAHRITVIHNGVDSRRFFPHADTRARAREQLGLASDEFCIGCIGNLFPVKDHMTLLRALNGFNSAAKPWRLIAIGHGPELPRLRTFVDAHPEWRHRVSFLGARNDAPELLNAMDVYVLSSLTEGISNSLLEAMATALPVVATTTGGNPEVVNPGCGRLFGVGDENELIAHLLLLQDRKDLRIELGRNALRRVRQDFSMESMVRKYEQLYEGLAPAVSPPERAYSSTGVEASRRV